MVMVKYYRVKIIHVLSLWVPLGGFNDIMVRVGENLVAYNHNGYYFAITKAVHLFLLSCLVYL